MTATMSLKRNWVQEAAQNVSEKAQGVKENLKEKKDKLHENFQETKNKFIIKTAMFKDNIVSTVKNNPVKTTVGVVGAGVAAVGGYMLYESLNNSNSNRKETIPVVEKKKNTTSVAEADTTTNFNEQKNILKQDTKTVTKKKEATTNPPTYDTQNFSLDNDRVMPKNSASPKLSETCNRINRYRILREGMTETFKKISTDANLTPNEASYMVGRMINANDGTAMNEADKLTDLGKKFLASYGTEYNEALKKGKIKNTIELNYRTGAKTFDKGTTFDKYISRMKQVNGKTVIEPKMENPEKDEFSHDFFFASTKYDWESEDFTKPENLTDWNSVKNMDSVVRNSFVSFLEGGKYGNTLESIVQYTATINSDPDYIPQDFSDVDF